MKVNDQETNHYQCMHKSAWTVMKRTIVTCAETTENKNTSRNQEPESAVRGSLCATVRSVRCQIGQTLDTMVGLVGTVAGLRVPTISHADHRLGGSTKIFAFVHEHEIGTRTAPPMYSVVPFSSRKKAAEV